MFKYPFVQQHDEKDCGAACLSMISEFYGLKLPIARFRELIKVDNLGANIYGLVAGGRKIGLDAEALEGTLEDLMEGILKNEIKFPFIARIVNEQMFEHFIVVYAINNRRVTIGNPGENKITKMSLVLFTKQWQGQIITFLPNQNFERKNERKGTFRKFFRFLTLQKKLLIFVFMLSVIISVINVSGAIIFHYILSDSVGIVEVNMQESEIKYMSNMEHQCESQTIFERTLDKVKNKLTVVFANINTVFIIIILMFVLRMVLQILRGYLLAITAKQVDIPLTLSYYNHLIDLPLGFHESRKTGEFMSRFYDASKIRDAVSTTVLTVMLDTIMAVACGVLLYHINTTLFFITLVIMVQYAFIMFLFRKPIKSINHKLMEGEAQVTSYLKESIDGTETVKAYQGENTVKRKTEILYRKFADKNVEGAFVYNLQDSLITATASVGVLVLLWIGTYLCINNIINIAELFVFYYLINYFLDPVSNLINLQPELQIAVVAAERLNDILDAQVEQDSSDKIEIESLYKDIRFEHVDFRYGNRGLILNNVNMIFEKGKKIAIVGESGCGKTTIAKLMISFYSPEQGKVTVDGIDLSKYKISSIRKHIAYISQEIFLFSDTIYNNLKFGNEGVTNEDIRNICKLCGVDEFIQKLPLKYNTMLEENGSNLSGGQKQRLAIARALLKKPDILIMDEATSNLDTITEENVKRTIENFSDTMTCIIIAHRLNTIKDCDYIYVMDKGNICECGTHQRLLEKGGIYKRFVNCSM